MNAELPELALSEQKLLLKCDPQLLELHELDMQHGRLSQASTFLYHKLPIGLQLSAPEPAKALTEPASDPRRLAATLIEVTEFGQYPATMVSIAAGV